MATQDQLPEGRFRCYLRSPVLKFFELKVIVPLMVEVDGTQIEHDQFMTADGTAVTSKGKKRAEFTRDALETLGASDPMSEIADALDANKPDVTLTIPAGAQWAECVVVHSGSYVDVNVYRPRPTADANTVKKATSGLRALAPKKAAGPAVNPFAPPGPRGAVISPPAPAPKAAAVEDEIPF